MPFYKRFLKKVKAGLDREIEKREGDRESSEDRAGSKEEENFDLICRSSGAQQKEGENVVESGEGFAHLDQAPRFQKEGVLERS